MTSIFQYFLGWVGSVVVPPVTTIPTEHINLRGVEGTYHDLEGVADQHFLLYGNSADFLEVERDI